MTSELEGARGRLDTAAGPMDLYRLRWLADEGLGDIAALPHTVRILLENLLRRAGSRDVSDDDVRALAAWPGGRGRHRLHAGTRAHAGLHRRARRGGPGRDAERRGARGRGPVPGESRHPRGPHHRSQRAGRPVPHPGGLRAQHRVRVPAQRRALHAPPLGAAGVRRPQRGPARRRDLPSGEPGASRPGRVGARGRGVPRHAGRHRLAHHDDQRPRRARLGRGRHRGRGRDARSAHVPPAARRDRCARHRRAAGRHHGDGPGADAHGDAARPRRGGEVRRVLRRRALVAHHGRPRHPVQHVPRVRGHRRVLPRGRRDAPLPRRSPVAATASTWWSATRRSRGCSAPTATPSPCSPRCSSSRSPPSSRRWRAQAAAGPRGAARRVGRVRGRVPRPGRARPEGRRDRPIHGRGRHHPARDAAGRRRAQDVRVAPRHRARTAPS